MTLDKIADAFYDFEGAHDQKIKHFGLSGWAQEHGAKLLAVAQAAKDYLKYSSAINHMALLRKLQALEKE